MLLVVWVSLPSSGTCYWWSDSCCVITPPSKQQERPDPFQRHAAVKQPYVFTWVVFGVVGQKHAYELRSAAMAIASHK